MKKIEIRCAAYLHSNQRMLPMRHDGERNSRTSSQGERFALRKQQAEQKNPGQHCLLAIACRLSFLVLSLYDYPYSEHCELLRSSSDLCEWMKLDLNTVI